MTMYEKHTDYASSRPRCDFGFDEIIKISTLFYAIKGALYLF